MRMGVIGYGNRINDILRMINNFNLGTKVTAITDINVDAVKGKLSAQEIDQSSVNIYTDPDKMLDTEELDGILIGTRCLLHTKMAVKVLERNYPLFLEKPVATNIEDLLRLKNASLKSKSQVVVSFPLKTSPIIKLAKEIIDSGTIGSIEQVQAFNNVPYGIVYYMDWYRDAQETGGLFLQKATHDFDYINYLIGINPIKICAVTSKQIFKGDRSAGLTCSNCSEQETCLESPFYKKHFSYNPIRGENCCFASDTGNEDSASAIIRYESGMHVNYSQNFFARNKAASRGARFLGYKGTLEFDWYKDELTVHMHHTPRSDTYRFDSSKMSHFGGDKVLAYNFLKVMQGESESISPIKDGLLSALMCLCARKSAENDTFEEIKWS